MLSRKKSLIRPERSKSIKRQQTQNSALGRSDTVMMRTQPGKSISRDTDTKNWWTTTSRCLTFYTPFWLLSRCCPKRDTQVHQAFREKLALCTIISLLMAGVAFITFGLRGAICQPTNSVLYSNLNGPGLFAVSGDTYTLPNTFAHPAISGFTINQNSIVNRDLTSLFPRTSAACDSLGVRNPNACTISGIWPPSGVQSSQSACHSSDSMKLLKSFTYVGRIFLPWSDIANNLVNPNGKRLLIVFSGKVLDITQYRDSPDSLGQSMYSIAFANIGKDITHIVSSSGLTTQANCLADIYQIAYVDLSSAGCFISNIILYVSLIFIGGVVLVRFFIALFFGLFVGWRQGDRDKSFLNAVPLSQAQRNAKSKTTQFDRDIHSQRTSALPSSRQANDAKSPDPFATNADLLHCLVMVPCYSEGLDSMKTTIQSIVDSDYPSTHKCIFVIADGIVQGSGNDKPTFEFVIDMMEIDYRFSKEDPKNGGSPPAYSYVAIADGTKRKNMAKVYAGWYKTDLERSTSAETLSNPESFEDEEFPRSSGIQYTLHERSRGRVPMILVVKVGNEEEQQPGQKKPGNRGKRDSQVILMNFLSKVMFDDRMTELEFEIFLKLWTLSGIMPEKYETVMMVDADTKIHTSALRHLLAAMSKDTDIIGICGETRVGNKWQSWVTMIQVFEYHISHNLAKSFETVFGVVTCLPGCFSVYRVSAPKGVGFCVPVLANPDIVEEYSENVVDTLHKKNLLLLGEDRYLSTLLLKAFPKRKMAYISTAICETIVPDEFSVLLSQRRRWINSTIHNLLELVQVRNLCGIFCFSMQFVIFMELLGTVVLPAAIVFTIYIIVISIIFPNPPILTLLLLGAILGLPGLLTVVTTGRVSQIFWMIIYLLALPIWNFVLPVYAFWHFDDFSWGETRVVIGDSKDEIHGKREGEFDGSGIVMKCWEDWIVERKSPSDARSISQGMKQSTTYAPLLGRLNAAMPVFSTSDNRIPVYSSNTSIPSANRLLPPNQGQPMNTRSIVYQGQPMQYRDPLPLQNARFNPNSHMNQQMRQTSAQNKAVDDLRPNYQGNSQGLNAHHRNINVTRNVGQNPNYQ